MKLGYTDINIVLDRSGSMESIRMDTIGGVNRFLAEQKELPGKATLTLAQFDDQYDILWNGLPLEDIPLLTGETFVPRGWTALLDAIGRTINTTGKRLAEMPENERPEKVIFVIVTDGEENRSREFKLDQINQMITHQRDAYQWEFVFIGANQDAIRTAADIGVPTAGALTYLANSVAVSDAFSSVSKNAASYRAGIVPSMSFDDEDRKKQQQAGVKSSA